MILIILNITLASSEYVDINIFQSKNFLNSIANNVSKNLPMQVNKYAILDTLTASEKTLIYGYTLLKREPNIYTDSYFANEFKSHTKNGVCTTPKLKRFPKYGVTLKYLYFNEKGSYLGGFDILPSDCGF